MVRRGRLVPWARNERSTGGWDDNGEHLDKGREKAATLQLHLEAEQYLM
jgi:hypothetical protein